MSKNKLNRIIVDVREPNEYKTGHIDGAINIPPTELMAGAHALKNIGKDVEIILYCISGSRSNTSMQILKQMGYTNLVNGINIDQVKKNYL